MNEYVATFIYQPTWDWLRCEVDWPHWQMYSELESEFEKRVDADESLYGKGKDLILETLAGWVFRVDGVYKAIFASAEKYGGQGKSEDAPKAIAALDKIFKGIEEGDFEPGMMGLQLNGVSEMGSHRYAANIMGFAFNLDTFECIITPSFIQLDSVALEQIDIGNESTYITGSYSVKSGRVAIGLLHYHGNSDFHPKGENIESFKEYVAGLIQEAIRLDEPKKQAEPVTIEQEWERQDRLNHPSEYCPRCQGYLGTHPDYCVYCNWHQRPVDTDWEKDSGALGIRNMVKCPHCGTVGEYATLKQKDSLLGDFNEHSKRFQFRCCERWFSLDPNAINPAETWIEDDYDPTNLTYPKPQPKQKPVEVVKKIPDKVFFIFNLDNEELAISARPWIRNLHDAVGVDYHNGNYIDGHLDMRMNTIHITQQRGVGGIDKYQLHAWLKEQIRAAVKLDDEEKYSKTASIPIAFLYDLNSQELVIAPDPEEDLFDYSDADKGSSEYLEGWYDQDSGEVHANIAYVKGKFEWAPVGFESAKYEIGKLIEQGLKLSKTANPIELDYSGQRVKAPVPNEEKLFYRTETTKNREKVSSEGIKPMPNSWTYLWESKAMALKYMEEIFEGTAAKMSFDIWEVDMIGLKIESDYYLGSYRTQETIFPERLRLIGNYEDIADVKEEATGTPPVFQQPKPTPPAPKKKNQSPAATHFAINLETGNMVVAPNYEPLPSGVWNLLGYPVRWAKGSYWPGYERNSPIIWKDKPHDWSDEEQRYINGYIVKLMTETYEREGYDLDYARRMQEEINTKPDVTSAVDYDKLKFAYRFLFDTDTREIVVAPYSLDTGEGGLLSLLDYPEDWVAGRYDPKSKTVFFDYLMSRHVTDDNFNEVATDVLKMLDRSITVPEETEPLIDY